MGSVCCLKKKTIKAFLAALEKKLFKRFSKTKLIMKMYNHPFKFWQSQTRDNVNYHINICYNLISMHS